MSHSRSSIFAALIFAISPVIALARAGVAFVASVVRDVGDFIASAFAPAMPRLVFDGPMLLSATGQALDPSLLTGLRHEARISRLGAPRNI